MRKLASIQTIKSLHDIPNADRIVRAEVLGWNVVVKKDEFIVGDKCVFFEVDSVLPETEWSEFMRPRKFRVKTCKLRGVLSQGLALPLVYPLISNELLEDGDAGLPVGADVTETLGVKKYEPPMPGFSQGDTAGSFPSGIPKTDETRLQSVLPVLEEIKGQPIYVTVKLDGTSGTFARLGDEFYACSRNWAKKLDSPSVYTRMVTKYKLDEIIPDGMAVQGEICGPGIQKNRLGLEEVDIFVFDVFDIKQGIYLGLYSLKDFCDEHGLKMVPVKFHGTLSNDRTLEEWLEAAKGFYPNTKNRREGIVVRHVLHMRSAYTGRLSFKVLNNDFLLKDED